MTNYGFIKAIEEAIAICKETGRAKVDFENTVIYAEWAKWTYDEDIIILSIIDGGNTVSIPIMETLIVN